MIKTFAILFFMLSTAVAMANETAGDKCMSLETLNNMVVQTVPGVKYKDFKEKDAINKGIAFYKQMPPETDENIKADKLRIYKAPSGDILLVLLLRDISCFRIAVPAKLAPAVMDAVVGVST